MADRPNQKSGDVIGIEGGETLLVGDVNELGGVCDDCRHPGFMGRVVKYNVFSRISELEAALAEARKERVCEWTRPTWHSVFHTGCSGSIQVMHDNEGCAGPDEAMLRKFCPSCGGRVQIKEESND